MAHALTRRGFLLSIGLRAAGPEAGLPLGAGQALVRRALVQMTLGERGRRWVGVAGTAASATRLLAP